MGVLAAGSVEVRDNASKLSGVHFLEWELRFFLWNRPSHIVKKKASA